jgi:methionyl-tRNA formyltransferase
MGTPQFAVQPLRALAADGHEIAGVVTRIDKPAGRGKVMTSPPVKRAAEDMGLDVFQPRRVREPEFISLLRKINPDVIVVAAYGQILPEEILTLPVFGCINIHASLLPAYRGAAPINWAIIRGEQETGDTIMRMDAGMDTGAILMQESVPIGPHDTAGSLTEKLSALGAKLITRALPLIASGTLVPIPQDGSKATLAPLLKKEDGRIEWTFSATDIHNRIRGLSPWPGAFSALDRKMVKIIASEAVIGSGEPGMLYEKDRTTLEVGCGSGMLRIVSLQPEGKKVMSAAEFLRGHRGIVGKKFDIRST